MGFRPPLSIYLPDHLDAAKSLNNLALLLKEQGAYAEAPALYERALVTFERVLEPNHSLIRTTQAALAKLDDHLRAGQA